MPEDETRHSTRGEKKDDRELAATVDLDIAMELASIKTMLQGIATDISLDVLQTTVQQLRGRITKTETCISTLEDECNTREETVTQVVKTLAQLQERVSYLEDGGRGNNVRIVGVLGNWGHGLDQGF